MRKGGRVEQVDLEPREIERLERVRDTQAALGLEVEVEVDDRLRRAERPLGERFQQPDQVPGDLARTRRTATRAKAPAR